MTVEINVAASSDDAKEQASGSVKLTSSDLGLVYGKTKQRVGMRFNGVNVPRRTITKAYIQFQVEERPSGPTALAIGGQVIGNVPTFRAVNGVFPRG